MLPARHKKQLVVYFWFELKIFVAVRRETLQFNFGGDKYVKFSQEQLLRETPRVVL